jgi:hypothetical protein
MGPKGPCQEARAFGGLLETLRISTQRALRKQGIEKAESKERNHFTKMCGDVGNPYSDGFPLSFSSSALSVASVLKPMRFRFPQPPPTRPNLT